MQVITDAPCRSHRLTNLTPLFHLFFTSFSPPFHLFFFSFGKKQQSLSPTLSPLLNVPSFLRSIVVVTAILLGKLVYDLFANVILARQLFLKASAEFVSRTRDVKWWIV
jgi:hypothetical protein